MRTWYIDFARCPSLPTYLLTPARRTNLCHALTHPEPAGPDRTAAERERTRGPQAPSDRVFAAPPSRASPSGPSSLNISGVRTRSRPCRWDLGRRLRGGRGSGSEIAWWRRWNIGIRGARRAGLRCRGFRSVDVMG